MTTTTAPINEGKSLLALLRHLFPSRKTTFGEALQTAELQANRLLELTGTSEGPVPDEVITGQRRIRVEYRDLPTSGMSFWDGRFWVICLNAAEPPTRQRFTLFHEFKHIIDHGHTEQLYLGAATRNADAQAEQAADYFAACALMPKRLIKRAWGEGLQRTAALAEQFAVSSRAIDVRLSQLGLTEPRDRCAPMSALNLRELRPDIYFRSLSARHLASGGVTR